MTLIQRWKQTALHNKALVLTSALVAFGTLFYAGAATFQVWILRESSKQASTQTRQLVAQANRIAKSMEESITASKTALEASTSQSKAALDQSIRASRTEQRAWIAITVTGHTLQLDTPISVAIRLQNLEKTPAKKYDGHVIVEIIHGNKEPRFVYKKETGRVGGRLTIPMVLPNALIDAAISAGEEAPDGTLRVTILKQPLLNEINTGNARLFVHGRGDYEDFFQVRHWITFCFVYAPGVSTKNFLNCRANNDIDSNQD